MLQVDGVIFATWLTYTGLDRAEDNVNPVKGGATVEANDIRHGVSRQQVLENCPSSPKSGTVI